METYHALTPVARPDQPIDERVEQHVIAPVAPSAPEPESSEPPAAIVNHTIEELAREGARRMLERALAVEVDEFLGRPRYERRMLAEHGYRNGSGHGRWPSAPGRSRSARRASATCRTTNRRSTPPSCPDAGCCRPRRSACSRAST
jgi:hypothetical protein